MARRASQGPGVAVVDASWYLPNAGRDAQAEYLAGHIPGAVFFDIDAIADRTTTLPHMLPTPADFSRMVGALGINRRDDVVVYDEAGLFSAPRVRWTFCAMGAGNVKILARRRRPLAAEGRPVEKGAGHPGAGALQRRVSTTAPWSTSTRSNTAAATLETTIVDARPAPRFTGEAPEPRAGLKRVIFRRASTCHAAISRQWRDDTGRGAEESCSPRPASTSRRR